MRYILTLLAIILAAPLSAGTYTITTTAAQDARLERQRIRVNTATCASVALPANCTQAQARDVTPGLDVYSSIGDMLDRQTIKGLIAWLKEIDTRDDAEQAKALWAAMTDTQKNAVCASLGLPNGCEAWPR
jgi:hypothetical protein